MFLLFDVTLLKDVIESVGWEIDIYINNKMSFF